jgi:hypothetical protein
MTAPIRITPEYELYRVITDYEALQDGFLDRIEDLETTFEQIEMAGELPKGYAAKLLMKSQKRVVKALGPHSLGKMLKGTKLVLALLVDDGRFAQQIELAKRRRKREQTNVSSTRPTWLFTRKRGREMRQKSLSNLTPKQRKKIARKAGIASGKSRRRKARKSVQQVHHKIDHVNMVPAGALAASKPRIDIGNEGHRAGMSARSAE